ncbi:MAG TPA: DUF6596 domain-containing protein, partial [Steroidobacteraceae bacterium]|nr:DUF6596 domain-containing protein [Steroidobacteraceae bacterium]
ADAFLVPEATMAQRFVRAKRKIAESGIGFDVPGPNAWPDRLDAVLSTVEIAYSKAHEDAACDSTHANYATEMSQLSRTLAGLIPQDEEVLALAATIHFSEARRPARVRADGTMCPLSEQDPRMWSRELIADAQRFLDRALDCGGALPRTLRASIQAAWCSRSSLHEPAPWRDVLSIYDKLLARQDDPFVRINRAVVLAEVIGPQAALDELDALDREQLDGYGPFHAARADFLRKLNRSLGAIEEYTAALACIHTSAEREWLRRQVEALKRRCVSHS